MDPFLAFLEKNRKILQPFKIHIKISGGHGRESAKKKIHRTGLMGCKKFFEAKKCELAPGYTHVHLTLIHKFWKKSKTRDRHRCVFRKKIQSAALHQFVYVFMLWIYFPESTLGYGQNGIYFCSAWQISSHIGIYHLK